MAEDEAPQGEPRSDNDSDEIQAEESTTQQGLRSENTQKELRSEGIADNDIEASAEKEEDDNTNSRRPVRDRKPPSDPLYNIGSVDGKTYGKSFQFMSLDKPMTHTTTRQMNSAVVNHMFDQMCFNQMHASKGIELFKERAVAALFKEYKQLNDMAVVGKVKLRATNG